MEEIDIFKHRYLSGGSFLEVILYDSNRQFFYIPLIFQGIKTVDILEFYDENISGKYKNHTIIMDNAVIHKSKLIREKIEKDHNRLLYTVPSHPELIVLLINPQYY